MSVHFASLALLYGGVLSSFPGLAHAQAGDDPAREFEQRLRHLSDDSDSVLTLGTWAAEVGLPDRAEQLYRQYLDDHAFDDHIYKALVTLCNGRPLPLESEALAATRTLLPDTFRQYQSARFVVLSDTDGDWTREQMAHLERAHHQFMRFARRLELHPLPLRHKLVCVLFEDRSDYQSFAREHDELDSPGIAGYYSPNHDRIVFYNPITNPSVQRAHNKLDTMNSELESLHQRLQEARRLGDTNEQRAIEKVLARYESHLRKQSEVVDVFVEQTATATTIHEATHQLMFHTQVQTPFVQYPLWISEGMATAFETIDPTSAFGPSNEFEPRRSRFQSALREQALWPLAEMVTVSALDLDAKPAETLYQQSYALITWMARFRRTELSQYLTLMRNEPHGRPTAARHLQLFEQAFGNVDSLERTWLRYECDRAGVAYRKGNRSRGAIVLEPTN